jgi:hypothetical protein
MFRSYDHRQAEIYIYIFPPEDGHIQNSVALDGNPELDLVHATGCKQPTLTIKYV